MTENFALKFVHVLFAHTVTALSLTLCHISSSFMLVSQVGPADILRFTIVEVSLRAPKALSEKDLLFNLFLYLHHIMQIFSDYT